MCTFRIPDGNPPPSFVFASLLHQPHLRSTQLAAAPTLTPELPPRIAADPLQHQAPGYGGDQCEAWTPDPRTRPRTRKRGPQTPGALSVLDTRTQTLISPSTEATPSCASTPDARMQTPNPRAQTPSPRPPPLRQTKCRTQTRGPLVPQTPEQRPPNPPAPKRDPRVPGSPNAQAPTPDQRAARTPGPQVWTPDRRLTRAPQETRRNRTHHSRIQAGTLTRPRVCATHLSMQRSLRH